MRLENSKILLGQDKCLVLQPELIKLVGRSAALLLQQIHYWSSNKTIGTLHEGKRWVHNTYEEWAEDLGTYSASTIKRSVKILKDNDLILVKKLSSTRSDQTNWYTINYDRLEEVLPQGKGKEQLRVVPNSQQILCQEETKTTQREDQNDPILIKDSKNTLKENTINHNSSNISQNNSENKNQEKPIAQQMIDIWNSTIEPEVKAELTQKRARFLMAALKHKFSNCLQKWQHYCKLIASSDFLMGKIRKSFKIILEAALRFDFIKRIFEKQFGIKDIQENRVSSQELITPDIYPNEDEKTILVRKKIVNSIGSEAYQDWFKGTAMKFAENKVTIYVNSAFHKDWVVNNYLSKLENMLATRLNIKINNK